MVGRDFPARGPVSGAQRQADRRSSWSCQGGGPDGVGGDDRLAGVVGGLELPQTAVGGVWEHRVGVAMLLRKNAGHYANRSSEPRRFLAEGCCVLAWVGLVS